MHRRNFIAQSSFLMMGVGLLKEKSINNGSDETAEKIREYLKKILYTKEEIDAWQSGKSFPFSRYHQELGWLLPDNVFRDGINKSWSVYTYEPDDGPRLMTNYRKKPCRINTYGNSYTQCHQVSDHETWQEVLAGHLQEPIRNFGIGGWSVYQAYLRMLKEEQRYPGEYIIFNIYEDDHLRNLDSWRNIRVRKNAQHIESTLPYLQVDIKNDTIIHCENPCPTRRSLYQLANADAAYELFKNDFVLRIMIAHEQSKQVNAKSYEDIKSLTLTHGIETNIDSSDTLSQSADKVHREAALFSTKKLIGEIEAFGKRRNKKIIYVLSYPAMYHATHINERKRWDQSFIDFLKSNNLPFIDLGHEHLKEFQETKLSVRDYLNRYFIGHYNPLGNFFCAQAIRDMLVEKLDPKPLPYRSHI